MNERPILFSGHMVQAILNGRKTQTRRVVKSNTGPTPDIVHRNQNEQGKYWCEPGGWIKCPYGKSGDRLWVRETWMPGDDTAKAFYRADYDDYLLKWKPSIYMPRWASRITLDVTNVLVERLQEISEDDAKAEGFASVEEFRKAWDTINHKTPWESNTWVWVVEFTPIHIKQSK